MDDFDEWQIVEKLRGEGGSGARDCFGGEGGSGARYGEERRVHYEASLREARSGPHKKEKNTITPTLVKRVVICVCVMLFLAGCSNYGAVKHEEPVFYRSASLAGRVPTMTNYSDMKSLWSLIDRDLLGKQH
ncbi:uncharacterized protein MYCGRDRAFT_97800 [Zymoseptoria tritici IPO323]|uniref:Uncharacterized protein n=1 Tax=Zymoseptoria tritici (strain CBS 115943 / IPO323) TaxID=336722 RepID=F9XRE8_ZYMTI|nr:uncharacterized protein MYCGRDRAFT_97800 [Zymoseptoria tritici IPO323]EGP82180.1 hypothetical protein MYCGRDRAFT_97800 [Zymoseptoria tritici IPO323]